MLYFTLDARSKKVKGCEDWTEENDNRSARGIVF